MPELPEVQTIVSDLKKHISGYKIIDINIVPGYRVAPTEELFKSKLIGKPIKDVKRVAKNILIETDSGLTILMHLAMTGRILLQNKGEKQPLWQKVVLKLQKGADVKTLTFSDMRMFGKVALLEKSDIQTLKNKYGPEPIENITPETSD